MVNPWIRIATDPGSLARAGQLTARDGANLPTPLFQPVATAGSLKTLDWSDVRKTGYSHVLMNTYHMVVRPGIPAIEKSGGLKGFTGWDGSLLTDSGGYQVYSLAARRSVREGGVTFTDHIEGNRWTFTPESVLRAQLAMGVDFAMCLDICTGLPAGRNKVAREMAVTHEWAGEQAQMWPALVKESKRMTRQRQPSLLGIVQGGLEEDLRRESVEFISSLGFSGIAVGGLAVGEGKDQLRRMVELTGPMLPKGKVHYLMGIGEPGDMLHAIANGFDMFDCVLPTRMARHGQAYTGNGRLQLRQARFKDDMLPLDPSCRCFACRSHSRAYLRNLFVLKEHSYARLLTLHNLYFYRRLMDRARRMVERGGYAKWWPRVAQKTDRILPEGC